jgi:hypothetical protein
LEAKEHGIAALRAHNVRLEDENAALRLRFATNVKEEDTDAGSARARALIDRILAECGPARTEDSDS